MTKANVAYLLEQLSVDLCAQGVKFDTATVFGAKVMLDVRYEPVSAKHDQAHVVVERVFLVAQTSLFGADSYYLDIAPCMNIFHLIPRSQIEAIEENLLTIMAGE